MLNKILLNLSIIPGDDLQQALRIRRFLLAASAYFICAVLCFVAYLNGFVQSHAFIVGVSFVILINIVTYIFLRSGLNLKMADPSLTVFQICSAIMMVMYLMLYANDSRGVWLLIYVIILLFGIFRFNTRQFIYVSIFTLLTYGGVIAYLHLYRPENVNFHMEYLQWVALAGILAVFSVIGGHISNLRANLSKSRSTIKQMTDNMHDVIFVLDTHLHYVYVSPSVKAMRGYEPEEVMRQRPLDMLASASLDQAQKELTEMAEMAGTDFQADISRTLQLEITRKNGTAIWTETKFTFIRDKKNGHPSQILGVMRDISERKEAEEKIRQGEEKYRNILESIQEGYFEVDLDGNYTFVNESMCVLTGYSREELTRMNYKALTNEETAKEVFLTFNNVYLTGDPSKAIDWPIIKKDGVEGIIETSITLRKDKTGIPIGFKGMIRDITERKKIEKQLNYIATHDALTGLPNRFMFNQMLNQAIRSAQRHKRQLAVLFIDLDRFKAINDTLGHEAGDTLLKEIAERFRSTLRSVDVVSRLGGDEFVVLIEEVEETRQVAVVAQKILAGAIKPVVLMGEECRVTASIGISLYPKDAHDEQTLMKNADIAMYYAKEEGKNNFQFYSKDIQGQSTERMSLESNLRLALERNEFSLQYQAKTDFKTGQITGVEALLRWNNPTLGSVTPTQFIPVADQTGLIVPIGRWVLKTACTQNAAWQHQGLPPICMSVNLSLRQLMDDKLIEDIEKALEDSGMAPDLLELEITEGMLMHNPERLIAVLDRIKELGVRLAIDDFGTGYSSLAHLKNFPIDTIKVDRSFIRNLPQHSEDKNITEAIINMGRALCLTVVAEGVETKAQQDFLRDHVCDEMQGFYFSQPVSPEKFGTLLGRHNSPAP